MRPVEPNLESNRHMLGFSCWRYYRIFCGPGSSRHHIRCEGRLATSPLWRHHVSISSSWVPMTAPLARLSEALSGP